MTVDATQAEPLDAAAGGWSAGRLLTAQRIAVVVAAVVVVVATVTTTGFWTTGNIKAVLLSSAFVGTIAVGATAIMLSGNLFSMSLGVTAAMCAIVVVNALSLGIVPAIVIALLVGALVCGLQGAVIGALDANPIVVTIGAGALIDGAVAWTTGSDPAYPSEGELGFLKAQALGIPVPFLVLIGTALVVELVLRQTTFGHRVYLVGDNRRSARAAGLNVTLISAGAFAVAGACTAVGGILLAAYNDGASLGLQGTYTFDAIAAVLVGGSLITGGAGSAVRTLLGAVGIAAISSLLLLRGYSSGVQILVKGAIVLAVVLFVHLARRDERR